MGTQPVGKNAIETAAALILFGIDPERRLNMRDELEAKIFDRAVLRALELRKLEREDLAQETANRLARAIGGK